MVIFHSFLLTFTRGYDHILIYRMEPNPSRCNCIPTSGLLTDKRMNVRPRSCSFCRLKGFQRERHEYYSLVPCGELTWQWKMAIEIVDFPIENGESFHSNMLVHQRVNLGFFVICHHHDQLQCCIGWSCWKPWDFPLAPWVYLVPKQPLNVLILVVTVYPLPPINAQPPKNPVYHWICFILQEKEGFEWGMNGIRWLDYQPIKIYHQQPYFYGIMDLHCLMGLLVISTPHQTAPRFGELLWVAVRPIQLGGVGGGHGIPALGWRPWDGDSWTDGFMAALPQYSCTESGFFLFIATYV